MKTNSPRTKTSPGRRLLFLALIAALPISVGAFTLAHNKGLAATPKAVEASARPATAQSANAQEAARPQMQMKLSASVRRGAETVSLKDAGSIAPGEVITYTVSSDNSGARAAHGFRAVAPIPAGTVFVAESAASNGAEASYSIDGGKTFQARPMIEESQADGTTKLVPAPVSRYTHISFAYASAIEPHASREGSYRVSVK